MDLLGLLHGQAAAGSGPPARGGGGARRRAAGLRGGRLDTPRSRSRALARGSCRRQCRARRSCARPGSSRLPWQPAVPSTAVPTASSGSTRSPGVREEGRIAQVSLVVATAVTAEGTRERVGCSALHAQPADASAEERGGAGGDGGAHDLPAAFGGRDARPNTPGGAAGGALPRRRRCSLAVRRRSWRSPLPGRALAAGLAEQPARRLDKEIRRRTNVVGMFPNRAGGDPAGRRGARRAARRVGGRAALP